MCCGKCESPEEFVSEGANFGFVFVLDMSRSNAPHMHKLRLEWIKGQPLGLLSRNESRETISVARLNINCFEALHWPPWLKSIYFLDALGTLRRTKLLNLKAMPIRDLASW